MASEQVLDIPVRRHVLTSERPFQVVLDGIYAGISQPDIGALFAKLAASTSYEEFSALVRQAQGSAGLLRFLHLDDDHVLALDPQADQAGRRLVRLIAGNPVTMGQMTRHLPAAGSYAPVTILIQELPGGGTQVAYDTVASAIAPYADAAASQVAQRLDTEVLSLLRHATGIPATGSRGTPVPENALAQSQTAVNAQALRVRRPRTDRPYRFQPATGGVVIMKAISMSPRSGQRTAGSSAVVLLHGHQLERNLARAVTAEAAGTFVLVLAITSAAVAAALSRPVGRAPRTGPWRCPSPAAWHWRSQSPVSATFPVPTSTRR